MGKKSCTMRPETPKGWQAVGAAYAAMKPFPPRDRVTATVWAVVAVLRALRETSKETPEVRTAFNRACDDALAFLQPQIATLRYPTTRQKMGPGALPTFPHLGRAEQAPHGCACMCNRSATSGRPCS